MLKDNLTRTNMKTTTIHRTIQRALTVLCAISLSLTTMGQGLDPGELLNGIQDPNNWYFVNLTAKNSTTSGGSGQVRLMTISMDSSRIWDQFMGMDITAEMQSAAWSNGNPNSFASQVTQLGFSPIYMPGVEMDVMGMALSSYAYFAGWAKANDGSYFAGWSFVDGGTDLGMGGAESDWGKDDWTEEQWYAYCVENGLHSSSDHWVSTGPNDGYWEYDQIYKNDKLTKEESFLYLKLLPLEMPGFTINQAGQIVGYTNRTVYATFRPVLVGEYQGGQGEVVATAGQTGTCEIEVAVSGRNIDNADFVVPGINAANWAVQSWNYDEATQSLHITTTYTAQAGIEAGKEFKATVTVASKGGSSVNIPLTMRSVAADRTDATVTIGTTKTDTDWATALSMVNAATGTPVVLTLNKNITSSGTTLSKAMTLDLNGYTLSGNLTTTNNILVKYNKYGGNIAGNVSVNNGTLTLEGGTMQAVSVAGGASLIENGATITGTLTNNGITTILDGVISGTTYGIDQKAGSLTINGGTIQATNGIYVEAGTTAINKGHIIGTTTAVVSKGNTTIEKLAELTGKTGTALSVQGGTTTINCGKFDAPTPLARTAGTLNIVSGFFKTQNTGITIPTGKTTWDVPAGQEFIAGYRYFIGDYAAVLAAGVGVCTIGETAYSSLEDALAYANNNPGETVVIVMKNDYILPAGYYTLPANATLLIPFEAGQETGYPMLTRIAKNSVQSIDYIRPFEYRRLTMAHGANLDVFGTIEVSGRQFASDEAYAAVPYAGYGMIDMEAGSTMTVQNGGELRVWGYMIGQGETDVRRGGIVREQFQMGDWKGGTTSMNMLTDPRHVFPLTQYYIQSIESPVKYHPGAVLSTATAVSAALGGLPIVATANDIKIVGVEGQDDAMFLMNEMADADNTWVRKWYDVENDIQTYEVSSSAHVGSMVLDLGRIAGSELKMHSGWFNLPITNNMKIHLLSGYMDFTQSTELLPGAEVEVDKESTIAIVTTEGVVSGALYVYDAEDWDAYAYDGSGNKRTKAVKYSPSWFAMNGNGTPTARDLNNLKDATINVHGTFDTYDGHIFTSEHGANIFSTNSDAGTFKFTTEALPTNYTENVYQVKGRNNYEYMVFYPARLKNADGQTPAYANTAGTEAGKSYCYINGRWTMMEVDEDDPNFMIDNYGDYYAKPNEYVAVTATKINKGDEYDPWYVMVGNDDHTFSGKYEQDRLFILIGDETKGDQWWEVTAKDNLYYCADNNMYYRYDSSLQEGSDVEVGWVEKKFTITWTNWDGAIITTYDVPYGTMAEYRSTNPSREANVDYTYDFVGWAPALSTVTSDVTYTATYSAKQRKYTIIFQTEGGVEIERHFLTRDEFPICENEPVKTGHILRWSPSIAAVTGDATYTATWLEEKPAKYQITFVNYNGSIMHQDSVVAGQMPTAPSTPTKSATSEYTYVFKGWKPALENAQRDLTYTAQFTEQQKTYTIRFEDENGNLLGSVQNLHYGETPIVPNYKKTATAQYTYTITWTPQVAAVSGNRIYRAVVNATTNRYTISCSGEGCTFTGAGVYDYGTGITLGVRAQNGYTNAQWEDGTTAAKTFTVTGDAHYNASATVVTPTLPSLTIEPTDAAVDLQGAYEQYMTLTLKSNGIQSADLRGAENLSLKGKANFDIQMPMEARTWYAIATPWVVNTTNGVQTLGGTILRIGTDIDIVYYDGAIRAAQGPVDACWRYVQSGEDLIPGRLYMAQLHNKKNGLRLQKKAGASITYTDPVKVVTHAGADPINTNWNGIANPATYHAILTTGATHGQFYNGTGYDLVPLTSKEFIVGQPVFIQAPHTQPVVVNSTTLAPAPLRIASNTEATRYEIQIAAAGAEMADHIYIATEPEKTDAYVIVKDLVKMGRSTHKAQIWVNRYDARLCVNTVAEADVTEFPLTISVPNNGVYTINENGNEDENGNENVNVYLTKDGKAAANLSNGSHSLQLEAGENYGYAIRIVRRAPQTPTGLDEAIVDNDTEQVRKVVVDGAIYILRAGEAYDIHGHKIQ